MFHDDPPPRRRRWPTVLLVLLVIIGGLWSAGWFYAAQKVEDTIAAWKTREARAGRTYDCKSQSIGGFPFSIHVRCNDAGAELKTLQPPMVMRAQALVVSAQVWQPTQLTTTVLAPMDVRQAGDALGVTGRWDQARIVLHGLPTAPERVDISLENPTFDQTTGNQGQRLFQAGRMDVQGSLLEGSVQASPVIQLALALVGASAPAAHPVLALPTDADLTAVLRGLKDFSPKPWSVRFRELQAAGGRIQITKARLQQGEAIAVASGELGLSPAGKLDGQLQLVVANIEKMLPALGLDKAMPPQVDSRVNAAIGALDRLAPGLGGLARQNAAPALAMGLNFLGRPAELEGKRAVAIPLRFTDGAVTLGPIPVGVVPPLF